MVWPTIRHDSPTKRVGIIEPDGILNGSYAKVLITTAIKTAVTMVLKNSQIPVVFSEEDGFILGGLSVSFKYCYSPH